MTTQAPRSVCYLGTFDPTYTRNRVIRAGLEARGWKVSMAQLPTGLNLRRSLPLLWRTMREEARQCDALIVAEHNQLLAPLAVMLGRLLGKPVIVDYIVGLYESRVLDNNAAKERQWRNRSWRALDTWNMAAAKGAFTDTSRHKAAFLEQVGTAARGLAVVPVGVDAEWLDAPNGISDTGRNDPLLVQFYGNFNPFHGTEVILRALSWLNTDPRFRFEMIGRGPKHQDALKRAALLGLQNLTFVDPPSTPDLIPMVGRADICLGVFARRTKTDYVVPHRIMECLALGKPVITAASAAIDEYFTPGEDLITVPPSNPGDLARTIRRLADQPDLRERVALTGAATVRRLYTPEQIVAPLIALLERVT
ncbi:MAG: glycosyltransferase [Anaerolineae bacterium]|nr:glycosyltransferase [Anaerolineae bacterium]